MKEIIEVTVRMCQDQLPSFLNKNNIEEYTWRKGHITIDLSNMVKEAQADISKKEKKEEAKPQTTQPSEKPKTEETSSALW